MTLGSCTLIHFDTLIYTTRIPTVLRVDQAGKRVLIRFLMVDEN